MITRRKIIMKAPRSRTVRIPDHVGESVAIVDPILALIHEHPRARRAGIGHAGHFRIHAPGRPRAARVLAFPAANPDAHGHGTHPRNSLPGKRSRLRRHLALIRRTPPDPD